MTESRSLHGRLLTDTGWVRGDLHFDQRITAIDTAHADPRGDDEVPLILPGFIDLHVHGGAGVDI
ncbi:MAG: N-acetylglucosamine-6-phosphate deacetylase, partial [Stenotrophomonas maltophilia]